MRHVLPVIAAAAVLASGCAHSHAAPAAASIPSLLIDDRGITMALEEAVTKIAYRPWIPPNPALKYAVIPPLGGDDTPAHRGVAVEYQAGKTAMLLSEWPKQNFSLLFAQSDDITYEPCKIVHYKADGVAWTTRGRLAMTLQPDGNVDPSLVEAEARRLLKAGACKT